MAPMRLYNTLTHQVEDFQPLTPPLVRMYTCGLTVYDFGHIGNFRSFLLADVLRRTLELRGLEVMQVMNITDVGHMTEDDIADGGGEDKMAVGAQRLKEASKLGKAHATKVANPDDPREVARFYTEAFLEDARTLRLKVAAEYPARMPAASDNVDEMLRLIGRLVEKGHAYVGADGAVYFSVESFTDYGQLSGNTIEQLRGGAGGRVEPEQQAAKRHPADFLLWKPDARHVMRWPSPFGEGYPGWHIECSAMAMRHLGAETIDIHTGGEDNIFPHHECEIAQTRGVTGREYFARYWVHGRHLRVEGEKMSKSQGNFYTVPDVLEGRATGRAVHPSVLRFELIKTHYRTSSNFTAQGLHDSGRAVARLQKLHRAARGAREGEAPAEPIGPPGSPGGSPSQIEPADEAISVDHPVVARFIAALSDDLNMSEALASVFEWLNSLGDGVGDPAETQAVLAKIDSVLGVLDGAAPAQRDEDVETLAREIDAARSTKNFAAADALRQRLLDAGYKVLTTKEGTRVEKPLA